MIGTFKIELNQILLFFICLDDWHPSSEKLVITIDGIDQTPIYKDPIGTGQNYCGWEKYYDQKIEIVY